MGAVCRARRAMGGAPRSCAASRIRIASPATRFSAHRVGGCSSALCQWEGHMRRKFRMRDDERGGFDGVRRPSDDRCVLIVQPHREGHAPTVSRFRRDTQRLRLWRVCAVPRCQLSVAAWHRSQEARRSPISKIVRIRCGTGETSRPRGPDKT
jgi:hypothetical protein